MSKKKIFAGILSLMLLMNGLPNAFAEGFKEGTASLLLPTTGQAMNGQLGAGKTKVMGGVEVASIATVTILGLATGGASVLWGAIPLAANHVWSSMDAYKNAKYKNQTQYVVGAPDQEMIDAQRTLETSRDGRFSREQAARNDIRERIRMAGEQASS